MLRSMTAFGRKESATEWGVLSCEIRSVNHRYLDMSIRSPEELRALEPDVRELVSKRIKRGKLDISLRLKSSEQKVSKISVNHELAEQVTKACREISQKEMRNHALVDPLDILKWPGVVVQEEQDTKPLMKAALVLLSETIDDFIASREREGEQIEKMLTDRCDLITDIVAKVTELRPQVVERLRNKLLTRLADIDVQVDEGRVEQELVIGAQKLDVSEELDRLTAHVAEIYNILKRKEPVGRRLDFLVQEFNREANTLSSKAADIDTTGLSVDLKVLVEQMREQIQNVE